MSDREYHGKEEEKDEEKGGGEWGAGEKWRRDPVDAAVWAFILIWAGLVFLAENMGLLVRFEFLEAWSIGFIGAGLIVLLGVLVRLLVPAYRRPLTGSLIFGVVLLGIGLGEVVRWIAIWPLILIAIGVGILLRGLFGRR